MKSFLNHLLMVLDESFGSKQEGNSEEPVNAKRVLLWTGFYLALFTACTYAIDRDFTGLITFLVIVVLVEIVSIPRFFMRRKGKYDLEKKYLEVLKIIGIIFIILVLIAIGVLLLNAKFHFWW